MTILAFPDTTGKPTDGSFTYEENGVIYSWTGDYWSANNSQGFDQRYVNADGDVMSGDLTVPSLNGGPLAGFRNYIINGGFNIAQRNTVVSGASGPVDSYLTVDRWKHAIDSGTVDCSQNRVDPNGAEIYPGAAYFYRLSLTSSPTGFLSQRIEDVSLLSGREVTVSFYAKGNSDISIPVRLVQNNGTVNVTDETIGTASITTSWQRFTFTHTLASTLGQATTTSSFTELVLNLPAGTFLVDFAGFQLEVGPVATPFEQRPIGLELQLCQRYFEKISCLHQTEAWPANANLVYWKTTKRIPPAIESFINGGNSTAGWRPDMVNDEHISAAYQYIANGSNQGGFLTADAEL